LQIQVNTDSNIQSSDTLIASVTSEVEGSLERFDEWLTHVSVYLRDENSDKKGGIDDIRCVVVAEPAGLDPVSVSEDAATWEQALSGALGRLQNLLQNTAGRMSHQGRGRADPPPPGAIAE